LYVLYTILYSICTVTITNMLYPVSHILFSGERDQVDVTANANNAKPNANANADRNPSATKLNATNANATNANVKCKGRPMRALIDAHRIVIMGHSAGGYLALWACSQLADRRLPFTPMLCVAIAPICDLPEACKRK
jgi:dienelactone hydrolase